MTRSQFIFWCDRVMYFSFLPILFFLPISPAILAIFSSIIITIFFVKRIALFVWALREEKQGRSVGKLFLENFRPVPHSLVLPVSLFFCAVLVSVIFSQFPYASWRAFIGKTMACTFLFFAVPECVTSRKRLNIFLSIFSLSAVFISIDAIWQFFFKKDFIFGHDFTPDGRVTSCFGHPNDFGAYLIISGAFFVALLTWAWHTRKEQRPVPDLFFQGWPRFFVIFASVLATTCALGWTFSRGAWIGITVAMIFQVFVNCKKWYVPLVFIVLFFSVFASQIGAARNVSFVTDNISLEARLKKSAENHGKTALEKLLFTLSRFSGTGRSLFWSETMQIIAVSPVIGTGLNTYSKAAPKYIKKWSGFYAHNCYLQMFAETGVVGLGSFLFVIFMLCRTCLQALQKIPEGFYWSVILGLFTGWVGFLAHSALDTNFYSTRLANLMWITMGLLVAVTLLAQKENP